jgi:FMN reductase
LNRKIVGLSGNVRRPSKTRSLVEDLVGETARLSGGCGTVHDLLDVMPDLGTALGRGDATPRLERLLTELETADALVFASPVYKGSYGGLFKHLIDLLDPNSLLETPVLVAATGGGQRHALVVEHQMRPLFGFFGAATVPLAVYASDAEFLDGKLVDEAVRARCSMACRQLVHSMKHRTPFQTDPAERRWA